MTPKRAPKDWNKQKFDDLFRRMENISNDINAVVAELKPYRPSLDFSDRRNSMYLGLGWI